SLSKTKQQAQMATEADNLKQIGQAAQLDAEQNNGQLPASLDALTNGYLAGNVLTNPLDGKKFIYVAAGKDLDGLSSNAVLAYSTAEKNDRAVLFADGRVEFVTGAQLAGLTNQSSPMAASTMPVGGSFGGGTVLVARSAATMAPMARTAPAANVSGKIGGAANLPAAPPMVAGENGTLALGNGMLQTNAAEFASVIAPQMRFAAAQQPGFVLAVSNRAPVLKNFQMRQNGTNLTVVDGDGSIYHGSLDFVRGNVSFSAAGTNLTLRQDVVFSGSLVANASASAELAQSLSANTIESLQVAPTNLPWADLRVEGTAVIGTNSISVVAAPATGH
ncbi:MAG TPA: hypothetical protein VMB22_05485, partial [Verrucomicrobiae bacterium]|nr:hypothetical protein [Verrucomicrobiae bacterium]